MSEKGTVRENSLVLYKSYPARVLKMGEKIEIQLGDGETLRVRPKDITLLHAGPVSDISELAKAQPPKGELLEAWELMSGNVTELAEITELIYGENTPATCWAAWQQVVEGLYFRGTPDKIEVRPALDVEKDKLERETKAAETKIWATFIDHVRSGKITKEEEKYLSDVEAVALGRSTGSRVLKELGSQATPENAHALLLRLSHWDETVNPYPSRMDVPTKHPMAEISELLEEERVDLTHLPAYAIDDEGSQDPDDAISLDGDRIWVHVADVAALIAPDSAADAEARDHGANLYLPERIIHMLPPKTTELLGLGLNPISPALSFGLRLDQKGEIVDTEVCLSRVKVTRLTYSQAETKLEEEPFRQLWAITRRFYTRRSAQRIANLDLPEVKIRVEDGNVTIRPLPPLRSRDLVTESMLMAGEAAARFALKQNLAFPFTTQPPPDTIEQLQDMAAKFAYRKKFKRSQMKGSPEPHSSLGLPVYSRATSPLRRYLDLVVHQQLRRFLRGEPPLSQGEILERVGAAEAIAGNIQRAERLSNQHWTLVYLMRNPQWRGKAVLVDKMQNRRGTVLLPELGYEEKSISRGIRTEHGVHGAGGEYRSGVDVGEHSAGGLNNCVVARRAQRASGTNASQRRKGCWLLHILGIHSPSPQHGFLFLFRADFLVLRPRLSLHPALTFRPSGMTHGNAANKTQVRRSRRLFLFSSRSAAAGGNVGIGWNLLDGYPVARERTAVEVGMDPFGIAHRDLIHPIVSRHCSMTTHILPGNGVRFPARENQSMEGFP